MKKSATSTDTLQEFVNRLVEEKGLTNLEPEVVTQIKADLMERLEDRINATIVAKLPPSALEDFEKMLDSASDADMQTFTHEQIPDLDQVVAAELLAFRQTYLGA